MFCAQALSFDHIHHPHVQDGTTRVAVRCLATPDWTLFAVLPTVEIRANISWSRNHAQQAASSLLNHFITALSQIARHIIDEVQAYILQGGSFEVFGERILRVVKEVTCGL